MNSRTLSSEMSAGAAGGIRRAFSYGSTALPMIAFVLLYFYFIKYIYVAVIGQNSGLLFAGFKYYPALPNTELIAGIAAIIPLAWLRVRLKSISDALIIQIYLYVYVPSAVYVTMGAPATFERQFGIHATLICAMLLLEVRRLLPNGLPSGVKITQRAFAIILLSLDIFVAFYMFYFGEISVLNLALDGVYERRAEIIELQGGSVLIYIANWSAFALAPISLVYGLTRRRYDLVALGLLICLESFAITSFRSNLFLPLFAAGIAVGVRYFGPKGAGFALITVAILLTLGPLALDQIFQQDGFLSWLIHFRFIGNNGFLTAQYFYFFETAAKGLYQDSIGRFLFDPVYNRAIAELVGSSFSIEGNHANGNLWADGYGNFGLAGVAIASLSCVIVAWVLDTLADGKDAAVGLVATAVIGFGVSNTAVHSVVTSNGGALLLLLLFLLPKLPPSPGKTL